MFIDDCKPYLTADGLFMNRDKVVDGNPLVYLGCYHVIARMLDPTFMDGRYAWITLPACRVQAPMLLDKKPRSYVTDGVIDQLAHDDIKAVACSLISLGLQGKLLLDSFRWFWRYDNVTPESMKWRTCKYLQGVSMICKLADGKFPNLVDRDIFYAGLLDNGLRGFNGTDSAILQWIQLKCCQQLGYSLAGWPVERWVRRIESQYGDMGAVFGEFHTPEHPFAVATRGIIL